MEKLICFWKGYIKIQVRGEQTETFSESLPGKKNLHPKSLRHPDGELDRDSRCERFFSSWSALSEDRCQNTYC